MATQFTFNSLSIYKKETREFLGIFCFFAALLFERFTDEKSLLFAVFAGVLVLCRFCCVVFIKKLKVKS
jgi:hypothetical protein